MELAVLVTNYGAGARMSFKVGDKVVNLVDEWCTPVGTTLTISIVDGDDGFYTDKVEGDIKDRYWFAGELVLKEIWDSPLYKLLSEMEQE